MGRTSLKIMQENGENIILETRKGILKGSKIIDKRKKLEGIEEHRPIEMKGVAVGMLRADFLGSIGFEQAIDGVFMVLKFMKNLFGDAVNRHDEQQQHTKIPLYFNPHAANIAFAGEIGIESLQDYFEGIQKQFYNIIEEFEGIQ